MMDLLNSAPNFGIAGTSRLRAYSAGDDFYEALIDSHRQLSDEQSRLVNARLILLLANQIGDAEVLKACIAAARDMPATPV